MILKLSAKENFEMTAKSGKKYDMTKIIGDRLDDGQQWEKAFFANNKELATALAEFGIGEYVNVQMKQDGKNWNIAGFSGVSDEMIEKVKATNGGYKQEVPSYQNKTTEVKTGSSDKMSKAEWAEKDRKAKIGMSIHNAVAAASRVCKAGTKPVALLEYAAELLPFLMMSELPEEEDPTEVLAEIDKSDPLNPPN